MYACGLFFLLFGFVMVKFITCYSDGTLLADYCQGMNINHDGIAAQTTEAPFTVTPEQRTFTDLEVGHDIDVTFSGTTGNTFNGFMLEARKCDGCPPAGTFSLTDSSKTVLLTCNGQNGRAVSHYDNLDKSSIAVKWIVPEAGTFFFRATVTQTYDVFWLRKPIILTTIAPKTTPTPKNISENSNTKIPAVPPLNSTAKTTASPPLNSTAKTPAIPTLNSTANNSASPPLNSTAKTPAIPTLNSTANTSASPPLNSTAKTPAIPALNSTANTTASPPLNSTAKTPAIPTLNSTANTTTISAANSNANTAAATVNTSAISAANTVVINLNLHTVISALINSKTLTSITASISAVFNANKPTGNTTYINAVFNADITAVSVVINTQTVYVVMVSFIIHYCFI